MNVEKHPTLDILTDHITDDFVSCYKWSGQVSDWQNVSWLNLVKVNSYDLGLVFWYILWSSVDC